MHAPLMVQAAMEAKETVLPPLQTVLELTSAHLPPSQQATVSDAGEDGSVDMRAESSIGHLLQDGTGTLADGSTWERLSGEEKGDNGYWCRCAMSVSPVPCVLPEHRYGRLLCVHWGPRTRQDSVLQCKCSLSGCCCAVDESGLDFRANALPLSLVLGRG